VQEDSDVICRYNISQNDQGIIFCVNYPATSVYIYNNTVYSGATVSPIIISERNVNAGTRTYYFYNNIIYNNSPAATYDFRTSGYTRTIDYNVFYGNHPSNEPSDANKITSDPQLVNPGSGGIGIDSVDGYKLQSTSPCINSGYQVSNHSSLDYWGNQVPFGLRFDRGAFEYPAVLSQGMTELLFPKYIGGKNSLSLNSRRMSTVFRIQLTGLSVLTNYRLTVGMVNGADAATSNGAGVFWIPGVTGDAGVSAGTLTAVSETIATDALGNVAFWVAVQPTGNSRFEPTTIPDSLLKLRIGLNNGAGGGSVVTRITSLSNVQPLDIAATPRTSSTADDGAFIQGGADIVSAGKFIYIWDNTIGMDRPLHGYIIEDNAIIEGTNAPSFYQSNVAGQAGKYGLVMPSNNPNGVRLIKAFNFDGTASASNSDNDGIWLSGTNTTNPMQGQVYLLYASDAPLPIQLASFVGSLFGNNSVKFEWQTISEINNYGFYIQRYSNKTEQFETLESSFQLGKGTTLEPQHYTWVDESAIITELQYRLKQIDNNGLVNYYGPISLNPNNVKAGEILPIDFNLNQNYPNPFNPVTTIEYSVPKPVYVKLSVFDLIGRKVLSLVDGQKTSGKYAVQFDGTNLSTGVYIYTLSAGEFQQTRILTLIK
jgi:hypothetical protein